MDVNIKAKLGKNTIKVDSQKHIKIKKEICKDCQERFCVYVCPARVYTLSTDGDIELELDGCLECGTCKISCVKNAIEWDYPRAGYGVQYRFG
jgi:ferredoxin like protein